MVVRLRALRERAAGSLFVVPVAFVVVGAVLAVGLLAVDDQMDGVDLPVNVASTVDASRSVLSTVASATMAFAGIAFSVALLVVQMSSSQYSPRVVQGLFRDGFNKRVMGVVLGTFTYCLVVLRSVHGNVDEGPGSVVPTISVSVAVVLGIVTVLAIVGFIDHNAHRMDVSEILQDVTAATKGKVVERWPARSPDLGPEPLPPDIPTGGGGVVAAARDGWLQSVEVDAVVAALPPGGTARIEATPGQYVVEGTALVSVWPSDLHEDERSRLQRAVVVGDARTLTQDAAYGLRQLVDVALRALSPGVNDPTTAQDAIFHVAAVLHAMLSREPPPRSHLGHDGRRVLMPYRRSHADLLDLAFGEVSLAAAPHPLVCRYLLEAIRLAGDGLDPASRRDAALLAALDAHAARVRDACMAADPPPWERDRVLEAHDDRFPVLTKSKA